MAPLSALQFASPARFQLSRPLAPSISVIHPASGPLEEVDAQLHTDSAMTSKPSVMTEQRFMAISSSFSRGGAGHLHTGSSGSVLSGGKSVSKALMSRARRL